MAKNGGARPGAGRKPGGKNRKTVEREKAVTEALDELSQAIGLDAFEGDGLALMQLIYRTPGPIALRFEAAKAALPFERPKLAQVDSTVRTTVTHEEALAALEAEPAAD